MTERPQILDLPGGPVVVEDWVRTGWGDAIPLIDAYLGIDTDALKLTALNLYGIPAQHDNAGHTSSAEDVDANLEVEGGGKLYVRLDGLAEKIRLDFGLQVQNWAGPAYEKAVNRVGRLADVVEAEANNARRIGQALWYFAEVTEAGKADVKAAVMGGAQLGLSVRDLVTNGERLAKSLTILGLVIDIVDTGLSRREQMQRELEAIAASDDQLSKLLDTRDPTRNMPDVSTDTRDWEVE